MNITLSCGSTASGNKYISKSKLIFIQIRNLWIDRYFLILYQITITIYVGNSNEADAMFVHRC